MRTDRAVTRNDQVANKDEQWPVYHVKKFHLFICLLTIYGHGTGFFTGFWRHFRSFTGMMAISGKGLMYTGEGANVHFTPGIHEADCEQNHGRVWKHSIAVGYKLQFCTKQIC